MPFFLIKELGWFTIPICIFFCYVLLGLENLSAELENPFGYDANDLPLDHYSASIAMDVSEIIHRRRAMLAALSSVEATSRGGSCGTVSVGVVSSAFSSE